MYYRKKELELLWGALLKSYGSSELATAAVVSNPQILNPSYTFCNTMLISKQVLVDMMGEEDALDVMVRRRTPCLAPLAIKRHPFHLAAAHPHTPLPAAATDQKPSSAAVRPLARYPRT